jgi:hypothetical protein
MVKNGVVLYGLVCYGMILYGVVRHGTVWFGMVRHSTCSVSSPWRPHKEDKRMVLEYTHGLFIT